MTLRIRLVRPAGDFLHRLAMPFFCAVPRNAPIDPRGVDNMPSAGPYYVAAHVRGQHLVLRRNPGYSGPRPQALEELRVTFESALPRDVEQGRVDYSLNGVPEKDRERLEKAYGSTSRAVRAHRQRQRYFVNPTLELWYVGLNTSRPAFASATVRRAVNHGLRRNILAPIVANFFPVAPTDQYLPPGTAGYRNIDLYDENGDVATARRLMGSRRVTATLYTCFVLCTPLAKALEANLAEFGIDLETQYFTFAELQQKWGSREEPFDVAVTAWSADYPDGAAFLDFLFDGQRLTDRGNTNISYFDDPEVNRALAEARRLTGTARERAYGRLDRILAEGPAPIAALAVRVQHDFFSARMGCQVFHPVYGMDLARLCVR
jgi:ABC-type oligopeptide transport system substrate-binding subunit